MSKHVATTADDCAAPRPRWQHGARCGPALRRAHVKPPRTTRPNQSEHAVEARLEADRSAGRSWCSGSSVEGHTGFEKQRQQRQKRVGWTSVSLRTVQKRGHGDRPFRCSRVGASLARPDRPAAAPGATNQRDVVIAVSMHRRLETAMAATTAHGTGSARRHRPALTMAVRAHS